MPFAKSIPANGAIPIGTSIRVAPALQAAATTAVADAVLVLGTTIDGLSEDEAERRRAKYGRNVVVPASRRGRLQLRSRAVGKPLVVLLAVLAVVSFATADVRAGTVIVLMVLLGVVLRFVQEARADTAAAKLKALIRVTATVLRGGQPREVPMEDLVPGDVVQLCAGDMIPADVRLIPCKDLHLIQSSLTGATFPAEKSAAPAPTGRPPLDLRHVCYLGHSVESGSALALVVTTGRETYLGTMAGVIVEQPVETSFDKGIARFTWLMIGSSWSWSLWSS